MPSSEEIFREHDDRMARIPEFFPGYESSQAYHLEKKIEGDEKFNIALDFDGSEMNLSLKLEEVPIASVKEIPFESVEFEEVNGETVMVVIFQGGGDPGYGATWELRIHKDLRFELRPSK